jgi:hypothetical protein
MSIIDLPAGSMENSIVKRIAKKNNSCDCRREHEIRRHMYSSSPTAGDCETFSTHDLVSYIDNHYRNDRVS